MNEHIQAIYQAVAKLSDGALAEAEIIEHIHPLFSRVLARNERTDEIYLANHSLGRPMDAVGPMVIEAIDVWYEEIDGAWGMWIEQRDWYRKTIAELINCPMWDAVVPKTSAGQGLRAAINSLPNSKPDRLHNIVSTRGEFDSIDFNLKAYHHKQRAKLSWVDADDQGMYHSDAIIAAITDDTDLVVLSMVCFVTGQWIEGLREIIDHAHRCGALVLIDAYHAFGTIPINFEELDADFLIAGNYKYTRGGAGACFLVINPKHLSKAGGVPEADSIFTIDTGWFAKQDTFAYRRTELPEYESGGSAWLESTPPPLVYFQSAPGLALTLAIGVDRLREYSLRQQEFMINLLESNSVTPRVLDRRGAFFLIEAQDGSAIVRALNAAGLNVDARPCPKTGRWQVRFCPDLLNTEAELRKAVERIIAVLSEREIEI
ncbi:MAG: aminotransferase class V-fold PLP-dependent enzyme [Gammaproteobacteria bacterium]|nr:aminotransferase class V-fold PLP-dependent enzyme [Gammaproteobacteria bacterium]